MTTSPTADEIRHVVRDELARHRDEIRHVVRDELARHRDEIVAELRSSTVPEPALRSTPGEFPRCPVAGCRRLAVSGHCLSHGDVVVA